MISVKALFDGKKIKLLEKINILPTVIVTFWVLTRTSHYIRNIQNR